MPKRGKHKLSDYVKPRKKHKRGAWSDFTTYTPLYLGDRQLERIYAIKNSYKNCKVL